MQNQCTTTLNVSLLSRNINIMVFIMVNIHYVLHVWKALEIMLPVLCKFMAYQVFQDGGLFIKPFFETLQFSFSLPKLLSMSMLRKKVGRFHFQRGSHRNKGKSFSSEQKYSCYCMFCFKS